MNETNTASFWRGEVDRADVVSKRLHQKWDENVQYYVGQSPDAIKATTDNVDYVNVNADFYQVEIKQAQLFFETPELQLKAKGPFLPATPQPGQPAPPSPEPILLAHRNLLNELLGPEHADVLTTVQKCIKDCLCPSGFGAAKIGYQGTAKQVEPPAQLGAVLNLTRPISVPIHESWYWTHVSPKKLLIPADFHDTDYDRAPWLGMRFRMPKTQAMRELNLPESFNGTSDKDEHVLNNQSTQDTTDIPYVDGVEINYRAAMFDDDVIHPEVFRRHVLIDGFDGFVEKDNASPNQSLGPDGRLTADSLIGNPIHVLTLRDVPDSAYPPSDCTMTRPLVRELCKFRTQMVQERDANRMRMLYDSDKLTPDTVAKITAGTLGDMIAVEAGALSQGVNTIMAPVAQGTSPRQTYLANDYVTRDLEKTLGINANQAGLQSDKETSATESNIVDRQANVRLDAERRRVLQWYLKGVSKYSALVCRFMTPQLAVPYIGQPSAQVWASWNKKTMDGRMVFDAKPDSQIRLDAAQERKSWMQIYQFCAKDPNTVRVAILKKLFELHGEDPAQFVVDQLPGKPPDENVSFRFGGEDLYNPMVREILAAGGFKITQGAIDEAASQMFKQHALGMRDVSGKAIPPQPKHMEHGGPAEQVRSLSQAHGDASGDRAGRPSLAGVA